jgi:hypothetical protein
MIRNFLGRKNYFLRRLEPVKFISDYLKLVADGCAEKKNKKNPKA